MNRHPFLWVFLFNIYCMKYLKKLVDFFKSNISSKKDKNVLKSRRRYRQGQSYEDELRRKREEEEEERRSRRRREEEEEESRRRSSSSRSSSSFSGFGGGSSGGGGASGSW